LEYPFNSQKGAYNRLFGKKQLRTEKSLQALCIDTSVLSLRKLIKAKRRIALLSGRPAVRIRPGTLIWRAGTEKIGSRFFYLTRRFPSKTPFYILAGI